MAEEQLPYKRKTWRDQCAVTPSLRERFGWETAIGYLVGEKFVNFVSYDLEHWPELADDLPKFVEEIKSMFSQEEITYYLDNVRNLGALGHVLDNQTHDEFAAKDVMEDGPTKWADNVLIIERLKNLLIDINTMPKG